MELHIRKDERFQQREWRVQRIGWLLLSLFVVAGAVGILGTGPLSWASARAGPVQVDYDRVIHHEADDSVSFTFDPQAISDGTITARLTGDWVGGVDIQGISPEPAEQQAVPGGLVLDIPVTEPGQIEVTVSYRAQQHGTLDATVDVGTDSVGFTQIVLP